VKFGELASLFQLGVGLNLGFGALLSFAEPAKKQRDESMHAIETEIMLLAENQDSQQPSDAVVDELFDISKKYRGLYSPSMVTVLESHVWDSIIARLAFATCGLIAFVGLFVASADADEHARIRFLLVGLFTALVPLIGALLMLVISFWYRFAVFPVIDEIQTRLFKFRPLLERAVLGRIDSRPDDVKS
jgi:hypothetical protein